MSRHNLIRRAYRLATSTKTKAAPPHSRRALITALYPHPPLYADDNKPQPQQPACYDTPPCPQRTLTDVERAILAKLRWPDVWRRRG